MNRSCFLTFCCAATLLVSRQGAALAESSLPAEDVSTVNAEAYSGDLAKAGGGDLSDLGLLNFFSAGWDEDSVKRQRATGTPDYALLRVQTNFMEREFRINYYFQNDIHNAKQENLVNMDAFVAYAFNRRFMIEVLGNYQWVDARTGANTSGGEPQLIGRFQLIDTESSSYTFNCRAIAPDQGLGQHTSTVSYGLAGYEDLAYWFGLDRAGFYDSILFDSLAGPVAAGATQADVAYDISIAKTLASPDTPVLGGFTVFLENYAQSNLDGTHVGRTNVTLTPGVRFNLGKLENIRFGKDNWLLFGADLPVAGPDPWAATFRFSYIKNF